LTEGLISYVKNILKNISTYIDQTMLRYDASLREYTNFVEESEKYGFRALVVPPSVVKHVSAISKIPVVGVAGFPYGYTPLEAKVREISIIAEGGGKEVDVVINLINLKEGLYDEVVNEIQNLVKLVHELGLAIKIIIETSILTISEITEVSRIVAAQGADFIKTNTGFGTRGVSIGDVVLIKNVVKDTVRIKAAGGIRTALDAAYLILYGADVVGASRGVSIVKEAEKLIDLI